MSNLRQAGMVGDELGNLMLLGVAASGIVNGRLLAMTLEQRYRNSGDTNTEITYTFPMPFGAVLMGVEVTLNGKKLTGEVTAKNTARAMYEEAISEGNSSVMLEKNHDGSFSLELGNLMAGEECNIVIRYAQLLATEHGQVRLMLPTTIAPRYGNPITQGKLQPHQVPDADQTVEYIFEITLTLMGDMAHSSVGSPSHKTSYSRNQEELVVKLSQRGYLDRDFILVIDNLKNKSVALACKDIYAEDQTALMVFFSPNIESYAPSSGIFAKVLIDCSGSMAGDSIDAAKRALKGIVSGLDKQDKFSLSRFGSSVEHRSRGMWFGTPQAKASAFRWIDNLRADLGGTDMEEALVSTIQIHGAQSDILLITDGEIHGIDDVICAAKTTKHRVFIVAIGASPAEVHLKRLASETGGHCDFVAPGEAVEPAVLRMSSRMRAVRATNLRVEWPQALKMRWQQSIQSFAFQDDMLTACAFTETPAVGTECSSVKLWGHVEGVDEEVLIGEARIAPSESISNALARLTAYAQYQETASAPMCDEAEQRTTAQGLALSYKLITNETNFILVHERAATEKAQEMPIGHRVTHMLAAGWGGTGSVNRISTSTSGLSSLAQCDLGSDRLDILPAAWKLSLHARVDALSNGGMDDYEIPAFLRKQEDDAELEFNVIREKNIDRSNVLYWANGVPDPQLGKTCDAGSGYVGITPAGFEKWLSINNESFWPKTYDELRAIGLGLAICEWLEFEVGVDSTESRVVAVFLAVVQTFGFLHLEDHKMTAVQVNKDVVTIKICNGLRGMQPATWPESVASFPESACAE